MNGHSGKMTRTKEKEKEENNMDQNSRVLDEDKHDVCKDSDFYKRNELPVDRGWAWVICFAGFLMSFNFGLANQTMAILFLEVKELFNASLTTASLIFLFYVLGAGLMSAFSTNVIVPRFGEKRVCCVTGVIFSLASIGFYLSPRIEVFLCCSAIKGICMGAIFVPSISLIRHYFHRRRSVAQILGRAGASAAGIVMPPLIRAIRYEYGIRGTFLIVAALELHIVLAGLLLRPVKSYMFKPDLPPLPNQKKRKNETEKDTAQHNSSEAGRKVEEIELAPNISTQTDEVDHTSVVNNQQQDHVIGQTDDTNEREKGSFVNGDQSSNLLSCSHSNELTTTQFSRFSLENDKIDREDNVYEIETNLSSANNYTVNGVIPDEVKEKTTSDIQTSVLEESVTLLQPSLKHRGCNGKISRSQDINALSSTLTLTSVGVPEESTVAPEVDGGENDDDKKAKPGYGKYQFCRKWTFRMVLVFGGIGAGNIYIKNYVPTIAVSQGATLDQAALLLTIIGVLDFISRISLGFFADTHLLKPSQIVAVSHAVLGLTCQLSRFFDTFPTLVIMSSIIGVFIGTRISMMPLLCIEVVGVEMMPQAFSIVATIGTLSAAAMNPSLGAVADSFGTFVPVLHILGVFFFISASTLLLLPLGHRVDKRNGNEVLYE